MEQKRFKRIARERKNGGGGAGAECDLQEGGKFFFIIHTFLYLQTEDGNGEE